MHTEPHPRAGQTVSLEGVEHHTEGEITEAWVEDWWDKLTGKSWMFSDGNPAAMLYGIRSGAKGSFPLDDEVVYVKTLGGLGMLVHESEIS